MKENEIGKIIVDAALTVHPLRQPTGRITLRLRGRKKIELIARKGAKAQREEESPKQF